MKRRGITLIEVVVVLAITSMLLALLLPAVQAARESARRALCRANLQQIGLALHNYESTHGMWPPASSAGLSWHVAILPEIDRSDLFNRLDFSATGIADRAVAIRHIPLPLFLCSSDSAPTVFRGAKTVAATSYLGNSGTGVLANGYDGMFCHAIPSNPKLDEGPIRMAQVSDGLSNTAAVSEVLHSVGGAPRDRLRVVWNLPASYSAMEISQFRASCAAIPDDPVASGWGGSPIAHGWRWSRGEIGYSTYNHMLTPMQPSCFNGTSVQDGIYSAGSPHQSIANVLFVDGHVQSVSSHISVQTWAGIGSRNGSEPSQP